MKTTLSKTILLLFIQFCFAQSATYEQDNFWMELDRPTGGMVFSLAVNSIAEVYAGMGNGVYLSNDDSNSWTLTGLEGITSYSLHIHQNGNVFAGTGGANSLYRMESIEYEWVPLISGIGNVISIMNVSSGDLFIGGWTGIYKSPNFGETWEQVLEAESGGWVVNAIIENSDGILFAGVTDYFGGGGVYRSLDNGDTWEHAGLNNKFISSFAINSNGMLFAGSRGDYEYGGGGVFRSEDNGITWEQLTYNLITSLAIDPNDVIYAGGPGGVFRTADTGDSWEHIITGMGSVSVEGLSLAPDGYLYAYHNKLHRSVEPVFTPNTILLPETIDIKIFPNPFNDFLNIELPIDQNLHEFIKIEVFDSAGRLVYCHNIDNQYSKTINLSFLRPGLYYVSLEASRQRFSRTILKY